MPDQDGLKILIVEDEGFVAMLLEEMLADLGHETVAVAGTVRRGAELARGADIDLAILDVNVRGELTYAIAEMLRSRQVPLIFATGYGALGLAEEWKCVPVLQKPFHLEELRSAIGHALKPAPG